MRYVIHGVIPAELGNKLDQKGGPGAIIGHLMTRFKPEGAYTNYGKRQVWLVVDFKEPADQAEFMILWSRWFNSYAEMEPVDLLSEAPKVAEKAIKGAANAPRP
jgi:hypothetical protein